MEFNFSGEGFKELIRDNENKIQKRTNSGIHENENFKRLLALLKTYEKKFNIVSFLAVLIPKDEVEHLETNISDKVESELNSVTSATNNHIVVNRNFDIVSSERKRIDDGNHVRRIYSEISKKFCVFYLSPQGIHYFADGDDIGEAIFYSPADQDRFNELKGIDKIEEILDEYQVHLRKRNTYSKFFVPKSGKRALHSFLKDIGSTDLSEEDFLKKHKQLLNNKPEDLFREDLRIFLESKLKGSFLGKEYILENFRRLDIFIQDDFGELHLIEVKWVGMSIHAKGRETGTSYDDNDINPDGILQSVDYIRELYETGNKIKIGYLAVFDARDDDTEHDTSHDFDESNISKEIEAHYAKFKKLPDLRVLNINPR